MLEELRRRPDLDEQTINRVYRRLARRTHPDSLRDDGTAFIYLQERFERFVEEWSQLRRERRLADGIDPYKVIRELGIDGPLSDREAFWMTLYRYRSLGLTSRRVRVRPAMQKRNNEIHGTLIYWAHRYDARVVPVLERFLSGWNFALIERNAPLFFMTRRTILYGLDSLLRYEEGGRPASRSIAEDRLRYARLLALPHSGDPAFFALIAMIDWLLREAGMEPLCLHL